MEVVRKLPGATNLINISTRMKQQVAFPAAAAPTVVPVRNRLVLKFKRCFCQILRHKDSWRILSLPVWRMWTFHELTEQSDSAVKRPETCRLLNAPHPFTFTSSLATWLHILVAFLENLTCLEKSANFSVFVFINLPYYNFMLRI